MKTRLSLFVGLLMLNFGFSQNANPWQRTKSMKSVNVIETKTDLPSNTIFDLDVQALKAMLEESPIRQKSLSTSHSNVILQFPNEKGQMESFRVFEAPVMHPDLSAKYPDIKSYAGQGIEDPTATIRFSLSPSGLQGMRLSGASKTVFIEPYTKEGSYTIYSRDQRSGIIDRIKCSVDENTPDFSKISTAHQKNATDGVLRTFRLAVSTTGEYAQFHGGTKAGAMAAINATMTRVNGIYETDFGVTMVLISNNDAVVYTDASSDPYTGNYNSQLQSTLTSVIGESNYDVGHVFVLAPKNGNAGCIGCVCVDGKKGSGFSSRNTPQGDIYDVDYVAHEMGHQFGGNHTFTFRSEGTDVQVEPGSGSTIMGYAGITGATNDVQPNSDPYFHAATIEQVTNNVKGKTCPTSTNTGNATPTANAGSDYTIPKGTPFVLTGQGTDTDSGDVLTYCWEQMDGRTRVLPSTTATSGVAFRSYNPSTSNQRYFPRLETIKAGATSWKWEAVPNVTRSLKFRLTVRDNRAGGGANNSDNMKVNVTASAGPFVVNTPNTNVSWAAGSTQTVTWDVAGTTANGINAANVDILLSTDGGDTYTTTIATAVTNDGSHSITVPNVQGTKNRIMVKGSGNIFFDISNTDFQITGGTDDNEAPSIPANLAASNATSTTIDLSWSASTDNVGVTGYDVYEGNTIIGTATTTTYKATGLSPDTAYSFRVKAKDASGNQSDFSTTVNTKTLPGDTGGGCTGGITTFPYAEGLENTIGAWTQATNDDINWSLGSNGTPSNGTGPSSAAQGTYYAFIEASGNGKGYPNKRAILNSPCFDLSAATQASFSFQYHMYGTSIGTLALESSKDNGATWSSLWTTSSDQGNSWKSATVDLASFIGSTVQLRFNGVTSTSWSGDIAIDDIKLATGTVNPPTCTDVNLSITFDNYPEDISWEITDSSNTVVASGGSYGSEPDGSTVTATKCLEDGSYTFTIKDSYSDGLCCRYGNGSYTLSSGATTLASGGTFGSSEATKFTIGGGTLRGSNVIVNGFETTKASIISIAPNPINNNSVLRIIAPSNRDISVAIFDMYGRKIYQNNSITDATFNPGNLANGAYLVKVKSGIKESIHRLIVE